MNPLLKLLLRSFHWFPQWWSNNCSWTEAMVSCAEVLPKTIAESTAAGFAEPRVNYRLRDAVFSRQRYWGEPFPICYVDGIPQLIEDEQVLLPKVDAYLPTEDGDPPLARASTEARRKSASQGRAPEHRAT